MILDPRRPVSSRSRSHVIESDQCVSTGLVETFAFFSDAANLEALTPDGHLLQPVVAPAAAPAAPAALAWQSREG